MINRNSDELNKIKSFTRKDDLPIKSQFKLSVNTVLNMIKLHNPQEIEKILQMNLYTFQELKGIVEEGVVLSTIKARYDKIIKRLTKLEYINENGITRLGDFTTNIFSNEIEVSQIFYGENKFELDEYLILLLLGAMDYEERKDTKFFNTFMTKKISRLEHKLLDHPVIKRFKWPKYLEPLTAIIQPVYYQKGFLEIMKNSNLVEGDIIRFLLRIMDKLEQISRATDDGRMRSMVDNCKELIRKCLEGIQVF